MDIMTDEIHTVSIYHHITDHMFAEACALAEFVSTGFCRDGFTRWYVFYDEERQEAVYYKW